jgi:hypothetical protein
MDDLSKAEQSLPSLRRLLARALPWRYPMLAVGTAVAALLFYEPAGRDDWSYFVWGSQVLTGQHPAWAVSPGGLHSFANYHMQIGPLTLLVVALLRSLAGDAGSRLLAIGMMVVVGPLLLALLEAAAKTRHRHSARGTRFRQLTVLAGGAVVMVAWAELAAGYAHFDDGLALALACVAVWGTASRRPLACGFGIALAVAAKPWAILLLPLALGLHGHERRRAVLSAVGGIAITWLPFVLTDPGTLDSGKAAVETSRASVLHLFGVAEYSSPSWVRPAQLVIGLALCVIAARRGRWPGVMLAGIAVRLALDPGVFAYYATGFVLAAFAWDLLRSSTALPIATMCSFWLLLVPVQNLHADRPLALLRLVACVGAVVAVFLIHSDDLLTDGHDVRVRHHRPTDPPGGRRRDRT